MKKLLVLAMAAVTMLTAVNAQPKKFWDFSAGFSDADRANLDADTKNWNKNNVSTEGVTSYWNDLTKLSGELKANGVVLEYTKGLSFSTSGMKGSNNFKYGPAALRMNRNKMVVNLPKLANGQTVTVVARSANSSANDRGFRGNSNMEYISGPDNGIIPGSAGNCTLVWQVKTESTDSVAIALTQITGGCDIVSIMIDNGDEPEIETAPNVAWLYSGYVEDDPIYSYAGLDAQNTLIPISETSILAGEVTTDSLETFDVVVLSESIGISLDNAFDEEKKLLVNELNRVPILSFYPTTALGYTLVDPKTAVIDVPEDLAEEDLFAEMGDFEESAQEGCLSQTLFTNVADDNMMLGYTIAETSDFAGDKVLATAGGNNAIHIHGKKNSYMLIPMAGAHIVADGDLNLTEAGTTLLNNAIKVLKNTKGTVLTANKPSVSYIYENGTTYAILKSSVPDSKIYYTLDDSDPTTDSQRYTDTLVFTESKIIKALVAAPAYNNSAVLRDSIVIKTVLAAPKVSTEYGDGQTFITLSAQEGVGAYYSFNGQTETSKTTLFDAANTLAITEPATIYAFAAGDNYINSEMVEVEIPVYGIYAAKDTLAHFTCGSTDWYDNALVTANGSTLTFAESIDAGVSSFSSNACYYGGKSTWTYYSTTEYDSTAVVKASDGSDSTVYYWKMDPNSLRMVTSTTDTLWAIKSNCQVITGEIKLSNLAYVKTQGASNGRYIDSAVDAIGNVATTGALTMGSKGTMFNARIESTVAFAAPFNLVVYTSQGAGDNKQPSVVAEVSADGENWTEIGDIAFSLTQRHTKKTCLHYAEAGNVYVRVRHTGGTEKAQICDIYVISTESEKTGIENVVAEPAVASEQIFTLTGEKVNAMQAGQIYIKGGKLVMMK